MVIGKLRGIVVIILSLLIVSCGDDATKSSKKTKAIKVKREKSGVFKFAPNGIKTLLNRGNDINVAWTDNYDSVQVSIYGKGTYTTNKKSYTVNTNSWRVGRYGMRIVGFREGKKFETRRQIDVCAKDKPKEYKLKVVKKHPHNSDLFTQGLLYKDGMLYEGTGQYGESQLLMNSLKTGKTEKSVNLASNYFGEGITLVNNKIYQITWMSKKAFVYNIETFALERTVDYQFYQAWGVATIGDKIILSDGTATVRILNTDDFSELESFQVFDNNGGVDKLNELEYVDGVLYANVWQKDYIVMIDISTGEVTGKIDCSSIASVNGDRIDNVLNGIAYNPVNRHFYVTGKRWKNLYEVTFE